MYICVDIDGTVVKHTSPLSVDRPVPGALDVLRELVDAGHKLIPFTMRSNKGGKNYLTEAVDYLEDNGIELFGIQKNPTQWSWTSSPKAYGHIYIDDAALGCPLLQDNKETRPYVDWVKIREMLVEKGVL